MKTEPVTKSAMITICGRPNVGKSTLTNALVGEKIAIVSNKPQTTRNRITAIVSRGETQFVLMDTPGFHKPRTKLGDYMVNVVRESVADVDGVLLVVEPIPAIGPQEEALIVRIEEQKLPAILVINKIDTVEKEKLLEVMAVYGARHSLDAILPISAKSGEGLEELLRELEKYAEEGPHFFPDDMITDQPERQICAELIREKLLLYKGIIIGKKGAMLKKIGALAREDMEAFLGTKVNLQTWVKVKDSWRDSLAQLRNFGYTE